MTDNLTTLPTGSRSELRDIVSSQLQILLKHKNYDGAKALLIPVQSVDVAEAITLLPETLQVIAFRLLDKAKAIEVYEYLHFDVQQFLLDKFQAEEALQIIDSIAPDERVKLFDELPPKIVRRLISQLSLEERQATSLLLGYQTDTAGHLMTPEYIALKEHLTATEAQAKIRSLASSAEVTYYIYVVDSGKKLRGITSLKELIMALPEQSLAEIMTRDVIYAYTDTDQEEVAKLIQRYDLLALPIVDKDENLLGVVTVDDVIDILQSEATEDIYAMGAVQADSDSYFNKNLWDATRKRTPWLLILLVTNSITVIILSRYEQVLDEVVALAFFTPLLIDAGGNVGAQSSTVVIRGLSTDELRGKQPAAIILRELMTGGMLGVLLAILVIVAIFIFLGQSAIGFTVGISLLSITLIAATSGAALPFLFHSLGLDPALMSSPFITTVVDILGILIYLNIAKLFLGL